MKIVCPSCSAVYNVPVAALPKIQAMGELQCSKCGNKWVPDLAGLLRELEQRQRRRAASASKTRPDLPHVSPLDREVSVDWRDDKPESKSKPKAKPKPRTRPTQKGGPAKPARGTQKERFSVRGGKTPTPPRRPVEKSRDNPSQTSSTKSGKNFSFGKGRTPVAQGFTDREDVEQTGKTGKVAAVLNKAKNIAFVKKLCDGFSEHVLSRQKMYALLRKEQFWTWAWLGSFGFLVVLLFLAYLNWDSILHAWPPASRIYRPD